MDIVQLIGDIDAFVWGPPMIILLLGSHLYLTIRTGFIQRKIPKAIKLSITKDPDAEGDISQFGALTTALSATIGTGNIVGVATAILAGGPGAVLWMWLTGVFGIATKYSETYASVKYRVKDHKGEMLGGAMYAWRRAFEKNGKTPWWGLFGAGAFALFAAVASFGIGSAVQSSAMTGIITTNIPGVPAWGVGLVIVIMVSVVIFGGVKSISRVCEKLVPFMAIAYALGCIVIIGMNWQFVWPAICLICECAFTPKAAFGGAVGSGMMLALQFGAARGLFSNESGLGSAPIVASAATTRNPARQALVSMTGTFW
ncbi:MAG: amino acid carrier protein, partial [Raoultibacter sp.]